MIRQATSGSDSSQPSIRHKAESGGNSIPQMIVLFDERANLSPVSCDQLVQREGGRPRAEKRDKPESALVHHNRLNQESHT